MDVFTACHSSECRMAAGTIPSKKPSLLSEFFPLTTKVSTTSVPTLRRVALLAYPPYACSTFHNVLLKINKTKIATLDALITVNICAKEK